MNRSICQSCNRLVPAGTSERGGKVFLVKDCPVCGRSEVLLSGDGSRYRERHALGAADGRKGCSLDCLRCSHGQTPRIVFVDVTNRCNLDCPICMSNVPSMGFVFEPPVAYFRRIFEHFAECDPLPSIDFFGGEPTVRDDLFEIIRLAHAYGFTTRVATNGLRLADEAYCRRLVDTGTDILFSYDGSDPEVYRALRGNVRCLALKRRALDNLAAHGGARVVIVALIVKGYTDDAIPAMLDFCYQRRDHIHGLLLAPLAHVCEERPGAPRFERIRPDEVEAIVEKALGTDTREFIPAGFLGQIPTIAGCLGLGESAFAGAHPDCESVCPAVGDGCQYVPLSHSLRAPLPALASSLLAVEKRLAQRGPSPRGGEGRSHRSRQMAALVPLLARSVRVIRLLKGRGGSRLYHALALTRNVVMGRGFREGLRRHTRLGEMLNVRVMPIQDDATVQTDRMARCPVVSAYVDPDTGRPGYLSSCAWKYHNHALQEKIAGLYPPVALPDCGR